MSSPGLHRLGMGAACVVFTLIMSRRRLVGHYSPGDWRPSRSAGAAQHLTDHHRFISYSTRF